MQALPLRDEVREARERSSRAEKAMTLSQQVGIALSAVSVMDRQLRAMDDIDDVELPGDDLIEQAIAGYPELAGLVAIGPDPAQPVRRRLEQRRMQLKTIDQIVRPIAANFETLSQRVHELQHQQYQILQRPEYTQLMQELTERHETRMRCNMTLGRLRGRRQSLLPAERAVELFLPQAEREIASIDEGHNRDMVRSRLTTLVDTLEATVRILGLTVHLPDLSELADPASGDRTLHEAVAALHALHDSARIEAEELDAEIARQEAELQAATDWMLAVTG